MRILFFTKYDTKGASSRYRTYQYLSYLDTKVNQYKISYLFGNKYLTALYDNSKTCYLYAAYGYLKRFFVFFSIFRYDLLVIESELFPYFPSWFEKILKLLQKKYIVDYDDPIFHNYDKKKNRFLKFIWGNKIGNVIKYANKVTVGSEYLYNYAIKYNKNVIKIPTVVSINKYNQVESNKDNDRFIVGWIGSPTESRNLIPLLEVFKKLSIYQIQFKFIGFAENDKQYFKDIPVEWIEWSNETEIAHLKSFSVGIMPLIDSPQTRGKCGFKLIQYMACKVPVIASPVGENTIIVQHNINGYLAKTNHDWFEIIYKLYANPNLKQTIGERGYSTFVEKYSLEMSISQYKEIIESVI